MKSRKHILVSLHRFAVGGAETQALYLAEYLKEKGYKLTVGAFGSENGAGIQRFKKAGIETIHWGFQEKLILNPDKGIIGKVRKYRYFIKLICKVRQLQIDTVIPFTYPANLIFCNWFQYMNVRQCVWNQRDLGIGFHSSELEKNALSNSSKIISNSEGGILFLKRFTTRKILLIKNGIKIHEVPSIPRLEIDKIRVVMVANINRNKDHLTLLNAWKLVVEKIGDNKCELVLAGSKADAYDAIFEFVRQNQLERTVRFLGTIKNVNALLSSCDIGVLSSKNEGLPNAILEYMASYLPVVASDISGNKEALGADYPFLFVSGSHENLAVQIIDLIMNSDLRSKLGQQNHKRVVEEFSLQIMGNNFLEII